MTDVSSDKKVTIAHLSDLHLTGNNERYQLEKLDRMLGEFVRRGYDHLVITGDLIDTAVPAHWEIVRDALERHGLFDWHRTTVIPGNHDLIDIEEEMRFYNALRPDDNNRKRRMTRRLQQFSALFAPIVTGDGQGDSALPFVKVMHFGEVSVSMVAVNSTLPWSGSDNPLGARGSISRETLHALMDSSVIRAIDGSFVIGLCHHAYKVYGTGALVDQAFDWTMEFKNRDEYLKVMKKLRAALVLHGHFHRFQLYSVDDLTFINGGSFRYFPERYGELTISTDRQWSHRFVNIGIGR